MFLRPNVDRNNFDESGPGLRADRHRRLSRLPGVGLTMEVTSRNELCLVSLITAESSLFLVREGAMRVEVREKIWVAGPGEFVMLQAGVSLNVFHLPSENAVHQATGLFWDRQIIAQTAPAAPEDCLKEAALVLSRPGKPLLDSFEAACRVLDNAACLPPAVVSHRIREVLVWLSLRPLFFRPAENLSLTAKLRGIINTDPGAAWTEVTVARTLGQSPATLRRRLAAEAASFREVLTDVRMLYALRLLHSTDRNIGDIARDSGYECPSRFARRFYRRFGFHPSVVRGHNRVKRSVDPNCSLEINNPSA